MENSWQEWAHNHVIITENFDQMRTDSLAKIEIKDDIEIDEQEERLLFAID